MKVVVDELLTNKATMICEKEAGVVDFFKQKQLGKLGTLFAVFKRNEACFDHVIGKMRPYITGVGTEIVQNEENIKDPNGFISKLLEFKAEIDKMV